MTLKVSIIKTTYHKKLKIFTNIIKKISYKYQIYRFYKNKSYILDPRKELHCNNIIVCNKNKYNLIIKLLQ